MRLSRQAWRELSGVGYIGGLDLSDVAGPGDPYQSYGPHGESSLAAQRRGASSTSDVVNFIQGEAEAVRLSEQYSDPNAPDMGLYVDEEGFITGADTSTPGQTTLDEVTITGERPPKRYPSDAAPTTGPAQPYADKQKIADESASHLSSMLVIALLAAGATKLAGVW